MPPQQARTGQNVKEYPSRLSVKPARRDQVLGFCRLEIPAVICLGKDLFSGPITSIGNFELDGTLVDPSFGLAAPCLYLEKHVLTTWFTLQILTMSAYLNMLWTNHEASTPAALCQHSLHCSRSDLSIPAQQLFGGPPCDISVSVALISFLSLLQYPVPYQAF